MHDHSDEYLKRSLNRWVGANEPNPRIRGQIIHRAYVEQEYKKGNSHQDRWGLKKLPSLNWFFHPGTEWKIDHHATFRLASFYIASNGHLVL